MNKRIFSKEHKIGISNSKTIDLVNKKFSKLLIIKKSDKRGNKGQIMWECVCDCGNKHITSGESIRQGKSKSCGCNRKASPKSKEPNRCLAIFKSLYNSIVIKDNKKRNLKTDISIDKFIELTTNNCNYCGAGLCNFASDINSGKLISNTIVKYNGLDRIDSSNGYILNNVVTCCKHCNKAKNIMSQKEFLEFIKRVYEFNFK